MPSTASDRHPTPSDSEDFLTPEQRQTLVADILSDIVLRIIKSQNDNDTSVAG